MLQITFDTAVLCGLINANIYYSKNNLMYYAHVNKKKSFSFASLEFHNNDEQKTIMGVNPAPPLVGA